MKGVDYVVGQYQYVEGLRIAAGGGSFGGYMVNWMAVHTGRFKAFISHAGIFDKMAMYGSTEELWFEEHDMAGTPWDNPAAYSKWAPPNHSTEIRKNKNPTPGNLGETALPLTATPSLRVFNHPQ